MTDIFNKRNTINLQGRLYDFFTPRVMGILNVTPDSFYDGGNYTQEDRISQRVEQMIAEGVDIIDVGAYSSRPGASHVDTREEIRRLSLPLEIIRKKNAKIPVSVDTFRSEVAAFVLEEFDVEIINDISGGDLDSQMYDVVAKYNAAYIMMHMRGNPQTMKQLNNYDDMLSEMMQYFSEKIKRLNEKGVNDIIVDPGFGFAKDIDQNYKLLSQLHLFEVFGLPLLAGVSRKSMIYKLLNQTPQESINGTTAVNMLALMKGSDILRVHDVKAAKECVSIYHKTISC